jgi:hypothetical protein
MRTWIMLLAAVTLVAGCGMQTGTMVYSAGPGANRPEIKPAQETATYKLFLADKTDPLITVDLKKGDDLGTREDTDGNFYAIAGSKTFPLGYLTKQVYWKQQSAK